MRHRLDVAVDVLERLSRRCIEVARAADALASGLCESADWAKEIHYFGRLEREPIGVVECVDDGLGLARSVAQTSVNLLPVDTLLIGAYEAR